ncbi:MAG: Spo0E family sporulation regulatory protein-aspartic acid phosphatase [Clostridia bacterium]|nr:Spo0E family sporulation regulatory protein-aspartic acid phosphatase [Clostridia bacterium]
MTVSKDQLYEVIDAEKDKLNQIVTNRQDLQKKQTIEQSWKLDKLIVLAMKDQLRQKDKEAEEKSS